MNPSTMSSRNFLPLILCLILIGTTRLAEAQSIDANYDYFPPTHFASPDIPAMEDSELQINNVDFSASYPLSFWAGKTTLINEIAYQRLDIFYSHWDETVLGDKILSLQAYKYTFTLLQKLSDNWALIAVVSPGMASDFRGDISNEDFNIQGGIGVIRKFGENLSIGLGAIYDNGFGEPQALPILVVDYKTDKFRANAFIPSNLELWYLPSKWIDIGLAARVQGNQYHGDPDMYGVDNPLLKYSVITAGPGVRINLHKFVHLKFEGGYTFNRRFDFYDGGDRGMSYELENTYYLSAGFSIGE